METESGESNKLDPPTFEWELLNSTVNNENVSIKVIWMPNVDGHPGTNFFVKYHKKGELKWNKTEQIRDVDYVIISELPLNEVFEFRVVSVDGEHTAESQTIEISTRINGK